MIGKLILDLQAGSPGGPGFRMISRCSKPLPLREIREERTFHVENHKHEFLISYLAKIWL